LGVEKFVVLMAKDTHTLSIQERVILPLELLVWSVFAKQTEITDALATGILCWE
jgi:hypothetical protein